MENQEQKPTPFMHITVGKESMTDAFNIEKDRYDTLHKLACNLLDGEVEGLFFERIREDGQHERGLDIAAVINHIQENSLSITELVLGTFFFGNGLGQIMQQVKFQQQQQTMSSGKDLFLKTMREAGHEIHEINVDEVQEEQPKAVSE